MHACAATTSFRYIYFDALYGCCASNQNFVYTNITRAIPNTKKHRSAQILYFKTVDDDEQSSRKKNVICEQNADNKHEISSDLIHSLRFFMHTQQNSLR